MGLSIDTKDPSYLSEKKNICPWCTGVWVLSAVSLSQVHIGLRRQPTCVIVFYFPLWIFIFVHVPSEETAKRSHLSVCKEVQNVVWPQFLGSQAFYMGKDISHIVFEQPLFRKPKYMPIFPVILTVWPFRNMEILFSPIFSLCSRAPRQACRSPEAIVTQPLSPWTAPEQWVTGMEREFNSLASWQQQSFLQHNLITLLPFFSIWRNEFSDQELVKNCLKP